MAVKKRPRGMREAAMVRVFGEARGGGEGAGQVVVAGMMGPVWLRTKGA